MGRFIVKLEERYFEYSTIVDAPVTEPMTLEAFSAYYRHEYGARDFEGLAERLARVEECGTSERRTGRTIADTLFLNRAGKGETELTLEQFQAWARGELNLRETEGFRRGSGSEGSL